MGRSKRGRSSLARAAPAEGPLEPGRRFYLYCEGSCTEPEYFLAFKARLRTRLLHVEIALAGASPSTLAEAAARKRRKLRRDGDALDEVWVIFDRDAHADWHRALDICKQNGLGLATSIPCFELWLLLHFRDHSAPFDGDAAKAQLRAFLPDYDKHLDEEVLMGDLLLPNGALNPGSRCLKATDRAQRLCRRVAEHGSDGNPSSKVGELVDRILAGRAALDAARRGGGR